MYHGGECGNVGMWECGFGLVWFGWECGMWNVECVLK